MPGAPVKSIRATCPAPGAHSNGGRLPDQIAVVFANTGMERPETLDFVDICGREWRMRARDCGSHTGARETLGVEWAHTHRKDKKATLAAAMETAFVAGDGVPLGVTKEGRRTCARTRFSVFANSSPTIDTSGLRQTCASPHPAHSALPSLLPAFRSTADCQITHLMTIRRSQTGLLVCVEISHRILMGPRWVRLGDGSDWRARR